jgi:hypothetical protein
MSQLISSEEPVVSPPLHPPFVLPEDAAPIGPFNRAAHPLLRIEADLTPGHTSAIRLRLWPFSTRIPDSKPRELSPHVRDSHFIALSRSNLAQAESNDQLYLLDPPIPYSPGNQWWAA